MGCLRTCLIILVISTFIDLHQCGRFGGFSDDTEVQSTVSTDDVEVPLEALAYRSNTGYRTTRRTTSRPTTRRTTPRPTTRRTTPRPTTRRTTPRPTTRRTTTRRTTHTTRITPRPTFPVTFETTRRSTTKTTAWPTSTRTTSKTTPRPTWPNTSRTTPKPTYTSKTTRWTTSRTTPRPTYTSKTTRWTTSRTTPRPTFTSKTTQKSKTTHIPKKHWVLDDVPPPPGSGIKSGKTKYEIKNVYNYNYPGYYSVPVPHHQYPGYYRTYTSYRYTSSDTGDGILGFYLGYKLAKLSTPTYSHHTFYDGYKPRYDHYRVHHYYHNADKIPPTNRIFYNNIVDCVGDTTSVCPDNTKALCTSDGTLMCLVPAENIIKCTDANNRRTKCSRSTISCVDNNAVECSGNKNMKIFVNIPCVSTVQIRGPVKYVQNTIMKDFPSKNKTNCTMTVSCVNNTAPECANMNTINVNVPCNGTGSTNLTSYCAKTVSCNECTNKTYINVTVSCNVTGSTNQTSNCTTIVSCRECSNRTNITVAAPCNNGNDTKFQTCMYNSSLECTNANATWNVTDGTSSFPCTKIVSCVNNTLPECVNKTSIESNVTCGFDKTGSEMKYINSTIEGDTTILPVTTTPTPSVYWKWKRSVSARTTQEFCVTVMAVPARRVPTQGEVFLSDAKSVMEKFVEALWNL